MAQASDCKSQDRHSAPSIVAVITGQRGICADKSDACDWSLRHESFVGTPGMMENY